jgi:sterol 3beta-glucosyltransferase
MASQADEGPAPQTSIGEGDLKDHVHDELNKRQRQGSTATVFPEPLRESDDSADEDNGPTQAPPMFMNMNQSIYGLIAQASSRVDFNDRFDGMSSDEEGESSQQNAKENIAQTSILQPTSKGKEKSNRRRKLSDHKLLRSLPALPKLRSRHKSQTSRLSAPVEDADEADNEGESSGGLLPPPSISRQDTQGRLAPVMSRMLEAKADLSSRPSFDLDRLSSDVSRSSDGDEASALSKKLKEIFEFDEYEQVIEGLLTNGMSILCFAMLTSTRIPLLAFTERSSPRIHVHYL